MRVSVNIFMKCLRDLNKLFTINMDGKSIRMKKCFAVKTMMLF